MGTLSFSVDSCRAVASRRHHLHRWMCLIFPSSCTFLSSSRNHKRLYISGPGSSRGFAGGSGVICFWKAPGLSSPLDRWASFSGSWVRRTLTFGTSCSLRSWQNSLQTLPGRAYVSMWFRHWRLTATLHHGSKNRRPTLEINFLSLSLSPQRWTHMSETPGAFRSTAAPPQRQRWSRTTGPSYGRRVHFPRRHFEPRRYFIAPLA